MGALHHQFKWKVVYGIYCGCTSTRDVKRCGHQFKIAITETTEKVHEMM